MIKIANQQFIDLEQAKQYVRHLLAKYAVGEKVTDPDDVTFLVDLIRRHPEYESKFRGAIDSFTVVRNPAQKATELEVVRKDGASYRTPWVVCLL